MQGSCLVGCLQLRMVIHRFSLLFLCLALKLNFNNGTNDCNVATDPKELFAEDFLPAEAWEIHLPGYRHRSLSHHH